MPNNPPAFPAEVSFGQEYIQTGANVAKYSGMTLLDYFAGQALMGFAASSSAAKFNWNDNVVARCSYDIAQAMLTERARRGGDDDA